ncbi:MULTISPECIES: YbaB/EbfC family nucleoid-associated protein [unclassified Nocardia]|uniref:YbaB/EbfC family nucleoid-associated protein n=1 Tax=unclassified Nocardia TaxID=2637762 RepID=UPI001CE3D9BF|nr:MULTISPECIES: YbaB/EbfC family nucleoid-associated protein [unclassified Nocardia]
MEIEDVERLATEIEKQLEAARSREHAALSDIESRTFKGWSGDGRVTAIVSRDGRILSIDLPRGLGQRPPARTQVTQCALEDSSESLGATCRAMVEAINGARRNAADAALAALRPEFPQLFDLIAELKSPSTTPAS